MRSRTANREPLRFCPSIVSTSPGGSLDDELQDVPLGGRTRLSRLRKGRLTAIAREG
jgi:hypothetical protein